VALTRAVLHRFIPIGSDRVLIFTPSPWVPLLPSLLIIYVIKSFLKPAQFIPEDGGSLLFRNFDFCPKNYTVTAQKSTVLTIIAVKISELL
jgi:hypothetical protein